MTTEIQVSKVPHAHCGVCPLKDAPIAHTTGPANAKVAIVSRSPGRQEAIQGKSFSGPSGKVLDHLLHLYGTSRDEVVATNVVLCQCEEVPQKAIDCCSDRLQNDVANCTTIIAAGVEAARALAGLNNVYSNRGVIHKFGEGRGRLIVTNNPAVVLREERSYPDMVRDFRLALAPRPKFPLPEVRYTDDPAEGVNWARSIRKSLQDSEGTILGCDIETRGRDGRTGLEHNAEIVCLGLAKSHSRSVVFGESVLSNRTAFNNHIKPLLEIPGVRYLWHNGKFDCQILRRNGVNARVDEDTLLLSWALDERPGDPTKGWTGHSLDYLLKDYLGYPLYETEAVKHFKKTGELPDDRARSELYIYNGTDTAGSVGLYYALREAAELDNVLQHPYLDHLLPLNEALLQIESHGWPFNEKLACDMLEEILWPKLLELEAEARRLAGKPALNLNSPPQLSQLYYDEWGLVHNLRRPKMENKGKRSTDKMVRQEILEGRYTASKDKTTVDYFTRTLDRHSELDTQRTNFFESLVRRQWPDGRIYYTLLIHGTETGRLSGRNPNTQNVTRPKEGLPPIRDCFVADSGHVILNCDLSQAELRAIAQFSGDEALQAIYRDSSRSLHREVAEQFYGTNYTGEQYVFAKNINFGVVYQQSAYSFAQLYGMDQTEAQEFIDFWWSRFPKVRQWTQNVAQEVLTNGEIQSPFGHKRRFYLITNQNKDHIVKEGINFLPQNVAANITLAALIEICKTIDWTTCQPKTSVHDSIVLHVKTSHVEEVAHYVLDVMESIPYKRFGWTLPFLAEAKYGLNWGACDTEVKR